MPTKLKIAPKQIGQSLAENKVPVNATKPVPVPFITNLFFCIFSLWDAKFCIAMEIPNKEEKRIIKPISLACKRDNCNIDVLPGVNKDGTKIARKAITTAEIIAIRACFLELKVKKIDSNIDFTTLLLR